MSRHPLTLDAERVYKQKVDMKPSGFWYAFGDEWVKWVMGNMPEWEGEYLYRVTLPATHNVLRISDFTTLKEFTRKLQRNPHPEIPDGWSCSIYMDWPEIANHWDGLEVTPYLYEARFEIMWYYGWDIASGCIWNLKGVQLTPTNLDEIAAE